MDPLAAAMQLLDEAVALIQELVAQNQSKGNDKSLEKKAELLAAKSGMSLTKASGIIKEASEKGTDADLLIKTAEETKQYSSFGRVASQEKELSKTGSIAQDKFLEMEAAIEEELGL
jgi:UDP-galactopyranose mutase